MNLLVNVFYFIDCLQVLESTVRRRSKFPKTKKKLQLYIKTLHGSVLYVIHGHLATKPLYDHTWIIYVYKHISI